LAAVCICLGTAVPGFAANAEKVLGFFSGKNGANPQAGVIADAVGNLYGTASAGGSANCIALAGCGTVFELSPGTNGTWTKKTLHFFTGRDGAYPLAGLVFDAAGNLYGTTSWGGEGSCTEGAFQGCGTVFRLSPGTNGGKDGAGPVGALIVDASGNLYGASGYGGPTNNDGTVFVLRSTPAIDGN
jgi:uncharacterized repeat protein (TIGR03803 family)